MDSRTAALQNLNELAHAMDEPVSDKIMGLLEQAREHKKWPVARLISVFERNNEESLVIRHQLISHMARQVDAFKQRSLVLGMTGSPGAGKSTLIGETCLDLLARNPDLSIAVLAIDPSSQNSGGALLGDRTRTHFPTGEDRLFFRSQASHLDLGGMGKSTFHVVRLLRQLFDIVIIETVGIGQSEIEVQRLSDHTCLVMQPLAGDQVQFIKAGIMEIPNTFIVNKCDEESLARKSLNLLKSSLKLARIHVDQTSQSDKSILLTSATEHKGIEKLSRHIEAIHSSHCEQTDQSFQNLQQKQEQYFLQKWVRHAYGEFGQGVFERFFEDENKELSFEKQELAFKQLMNRFLTHLN